MVRVVVSAGLDAEAGHGAASGAGEGRRGAASPTGDPYVGFGTLLQVAGPLAVTTDRRDDESVGRAQPEQRNGSTQAATTAGRLDDEDARASQRVAQPGAHHWLDDSIE